MYQTTILSVFDTATVICGYDVSKEAFDEKAVVIEEELLHYHKLYDIYTNYGDNNLKTINEKAGKEAVKVSSEIIDMLSYGIDMYEKTDGMTNIAIGSVTKLWHDAREDGTYVPTYEDLSLAAEHTDIENIVIDKKENTVYIKDENTRIDVGAVAKGYAVDRVCDMMKEKGWVSYALSVGGNVKTLGEKREDVPWKIGIQDPSGIKSHFALVEVSGKSLVTSGSYQRYYEVDGVVYHHIINPHTLYPENIYTSVSVLCESSAFGDSLSTALFSMSYEDGKKMCEEFSDVDVVWRFADGSCKMTDGIKEIITFTE